MAREIKDLTLATKAQVEAANTFFVIAADTEDTDTDADDPLKVDVATMKEVFGNKPTLSTITNLGTSYTNIGSPMADTDVISISTKGTVSGNVVHDGDPIVVGAIGSSGDWIPIKGGEQGARIEIKKLSTGQIQVRRLVISSVRVDLIKWT